MTAEAFVEELVTAASLDTIGGGGHFVIDDHIVERTDSVWRAIDSVVRQRVVSLKGKPLEPRYFLGLAHLEIQLGRDAAAQQHLEAWLTTPGTTAKDSMVAIEMVVEALLRQDVTNARISIARRYVEQLATFRTSVAQQWLFAGRRAMMGAFDGRGQSDSAAAWGLKAYALLETMSYEDRAFLIADAMPLATLARNLAGLPNGLARVDSLVTALKRAIVPSPVEVAKDTLLRLVQQWTQPVAQEAFTMVSWFGKPMPPFVATHWLNHARPSTVSDAAPGARALRLDDGVIRIVGFGWFSCPGCQAALRRAQMALSQLPKGVEFIFNERSMGTFNGAFCEPEEEVEDLRKWYLERKRLTFPIAIWAPMKDSTPGGGLLPRESPLWRALQIKVGPTIYIVDGRGIIRYMGFGFPRFDANMLHDPLRLALDAVVRERDTRDRDTRADGTRDRDTQERDTRAVQATAHATSQER